MTRKWRIFLIILGLFWVTVLAFKYSPLYNKVLWHSVALENKSPYRLSNLSINVPRDWIVIGENTFDYDYGKLMVHFASIGNGRVEDKLLWIKQNKQKNNIQTTKVTYRVGCKNSNGFIEESTVDKVQLESVIIAFEPDVLIYADFIVDSDHVKRKAVLERFLSNNVSCVESSSSLK